MVNFEVDGESLAILRNPNFLFFDKFTITNALFSLIFNVRYYHEYLIGTYGYATNGGNLITPFAIPMPAYSYLVPGDSASNCFDHNDVKNPDKYGCGGDKDILFDSFATTYNEYIKIEKGYAQPKKCEFKNDYIDSESQCLNACKGVDKFSCTCMNKNYNSQMLVKGSVTDSVFSNSGYIIYCKTFNYTNFAKAKNITINHIRTAKETKKFTLQFWVYFYNYVDGNFEGANFFGKDIIILQFLKKLWVIKIYILQNVK
jgi:hypothetical protein